MAGAVLLVGLGVAYQFLGGAKRSVQQVARVEPDRTYQLRISGQLELPGDVQIADVQGRASVDRRSF